VETKQIVRSFTDINTISFDINKTGNLIAICGFEKKTNIYDINTGALVKELADILENYVSSLGASALKFSDNGLLFINLQNEIQGIPHNTIVSVNTMTWQPINKIEISSFKGYNDNYTNVQKFVITEDDKYLAVCFWETSIVKIYDLVNYIQLKEFKAHIIQTYGIDFSPDGSLLATVGDDGLVKLWRTSDWKLEKSFLHDSVYPGGDISSVKFSPEGNYLVSGGGIFTSPSTRIWDKNNFENKYVYNTPLHRAVAISVNDSMKLIALAVNKSGIIVYNA